MSSRIAGAVNAGAEQAPKPSAAVAMAVLTIQRERLVLKRQIIAAFSSGETERAADLSNTRDALARIAGEVMV